MSNLNKILVGGMIFLAGLLPLKKAESQTIDVSTAYNEYIYWGIPFSDGFVNQPMANIKNSDSTLTAGTMLNIDKGKINEVDILGGITKHINSQLSVFAGFVYFAWNNPQASWENIVSTYAGINAPLFLNPEITFYKSFIDANGKYIEAKVSKDFEIVEGRFSISTSAILGYNANLSEIKLVLAI